MEYRTVPLTKGATTRVSDKDYERVASHKWHLHSAGYAARTQRYGPGGKKKRVIYMHRFVLGAPDGYEVDHINRDPLDNTRANLRLVPKALNRANTDKRRDSTRRYKGAVYNPHKGARPWTARVTRDGVHHYGGYFATEIEAAHEYDRMAREVFGEHARLNFPD
jgi:hypothetical protein